MAKELNKHQDTESKLDETLERNDKTEFAAKKEDDPIMEVEVHNLEEPGVMVNVVYGPSKNLKKYKLMHGGKYKLPLSVIRHIESRRVPIYEYKPDGTGSMRAVAVGYKNRFSCKQVF